MGNIDKEYPTCPKNIYEIDRAYLPCVESMSTGSGSALMSIISTSHHRCSTVQISR